MGAIFRVVALVYEAVRATEASPAQKTHTDDYLSAALNLPSRTLGFDVERLWLKQC